MRSDCCVLIVVVVFLSINVTSGQEDATRNSDLPERCFEEESIDSKITVAELRLEEVKIPLIIATFILTVILVKIGWHHPLMHNIAKHIPESLVLITIGTFIGGLLVSFFKLDECNRDEVFPVRFTPTLFFIYLLPPIVFASGYFMNLKAFFENFVTIIIFALIGTIWNAFALGFTLYGLSEANLTSSKLTISSALLFGTITAAVDPVAVLAVFEEIHVNQLLHILVFGESLLNDAVTIVLFEVLGAFANIPFDEETDHNTAVDIVVGIFQFVVVVIASIIIGLIFGCVGVLLTRISHHVHVLEPIMLYTIGFVSYVMADLFAFSGIVSLITCSIIMKHYVPANIAWKSNITFKYTLKMLNIIMEMIIFMFLGISLFDPEVHKWDTGLVISTLVFSFIFRPIGVVVLSLLVNLRRLHKISKKQMFIMSYSGLRGAVAFSLALSRVFEPGLQSLPPEQLAEEQDVRRSMLTATTVLLLFTVFVQGSTIKPLVQIMGVKLDVSHHANMNQVIHKTAIDHITTGVEDIAGHFGFNVIKEFFLYIDVKYLRKIFERHTEAIDEEIIRKYQTLQLKETTSQVFQVCNIQQDPVDVPPIEPPLTTTLNVPTTDQEVLLRNKSTESLNESCVPALTEVLRMSYPHPHDSHYMHILSRDEHEIQDHHLEKVKLQHRLRKRSKKRRRARTALGLKHSPKKLEETDFAGIAEKGGEDTIESPVVHFEVGNSDEETKL